jgi:hypothetical protein
MSKLLIVLAALAVAVVMAQDAPASTSIFPLSSFVIMRALWFTRVCCVLLRDDS